MSAQLVRADARALPVRPRSVDLVVVSPPYFRVRDYTDGGVSLADQIGNEDTYVEYLDHLWQVTAACVEALKPTGSLFVNVGDRYMERSGPGRVASDVDEGRLPTRRKVQRPARLKQDNIRAKSLMFLPQRFAIGCVDELGLIARAEIIWGKPSAMPESAQDRSHRTHEHWFHFVLKPIYYSAIDEVRQPHAARTQYLAGWEERVSYDRERVNPNRRDGGGPTGVTPNPLGKIPGSVWTIATEPLTVPDHIKIDLDDEHFAPFPREWPRRLIRGWCPPGGVVLDPMGGTGTTAMVAHALGRRAVHVELSAGYSRLARWRIFESDGASKVRERTNREAQGAML